MPYIGNPIYQSAFVTDQFSGDGTTTAFTMSVSPAGTTNVLVVVSGVVQDPSTYGVTGTTLNFSAAPPSGTGNISCRYLGVPVTGVTTTAYRTVTEFTATASQTTFTPPSYNVGFINVYLNGVLLGSADYTATNGTTVVLATGASAGNILTVESFQISSVANAIANAAGAVTSANIQTSVALTTPTMTSPTISSGPLTIGTTALGAGDSSAMKNRIINGAMVIDQRNAGAAVTTTGSYPVDRFYVNNSSDATFSAQQSTDVPTGQGFVNSLKVTYPTGDASIGATQYSNIQQNIEGFNVADLGFGSSGAKTVTLSFWVKATVAGQYSYAIYNSAENRINPQPFTINASNTWEFKSITYAGDTTGTWLTTNGKGLTVTVYTALGSNFLGSAGWNAGGTYGVTGQANAMASNGNIFAITGVQLEVGSSATGFEYRQYGTELILCQRYFQKTNPDNVSLRCGGLNGVVYSTTNCGFYYTMPVQMRTAPSIARGGTNDDFYIAGISTNVSGTFNSTTTSVGTVWAETINLSAGANGYQVVYNGQLSLNSEL